MPKLKRLSGKDVTQILKELGFTVYSQQGSHIKFERTLNGEHERVVVPVHGSKTIATGTLQSIYKQVLKFVPESELRKHFYTD